MHMPIVITVKDAGSYSSKPTRSQKPNIKEHCNSQPPESACVLEPPAEHYS